MTKTVSVCIPTIPGREELLELALNSALDQTRKADEILVQCDDRRDGAAPTRNKLIQQVQTDYIAWLDDDDVLLPNHLQVLMDCIGDADLIYPTPVMEPQTARDPTAVTFMGKLQLPWGVPFRWEQKNYLLNVGSFIPMTHLVKTETVKAAGGFPIPGTSEWPKPNVEDWGYLIRLLRHGAKFTHVNEVTWKWRVHKYNTGGTSRGEVR